MALKIVESHVAYTRCIAKVLDHKGQLLTYITMPINYDGKDFNTVHEHDNLTAARTFIGVNTNPKKAHKAPVAKPKMRSLPQSQKGYHAPTK